MTHTDPPGSRTFVLFGAARVGSNYLISLINQHPQILCHYEVFNPRKIHWTDLPLELKERLDERWDLERRDRDPEGFMRDLLSIDAGRDVVGFNLFPLQNDGIVDRCLADPTMIKVLQRRRDVVRTYVSILIARKTQRWGRREGDEKPSVEERRVSFDPMDFLKTMRMRADFCRKVEMALITTGQEYTVVDYEDLMEHRDDTLRRIFRRLGVEEDVSPGPSRLQRQNPEPLEELVTNYEEMDRFLTTYDFKRLGFRGTAAMKMRDLPRRAWRRLTG